MDWLKFLIAASLLPIFPFSLIFNRVISWAPAYWVQAAAVVALPQVGIRLATSLPGSQLSLLHSRAWLALVMLTAVFYGFRALSVRDVTIWARLMATSGLTLAWVLRAPLTATRGMSAAALAWSVPTALVMILAGLLARRAGGAYLGLQGGLATVLPRLSGLLTLSALAVVATPVFPSFFALIHVFSAVSLPWIWPLLLVLLIWGWSVGNFLQELLFGGYHGETMRDLSILGASVGAVALGLFALSGLLWSGVWIGI